MPSYVVNLRIGFLLHVTHSPLYDVINIGFKVEVKPGIIYIYIFFIYLFIIIIENPNRQHSKVLYHWGGQKRKEENSEKYINVYIHTYIYKFMCDYLPLSSKCI